MALNIETLVGAILGAVKAVLKKHWKEAKHYAEAESRKLATTLENIAALLAEGKIKEEQAKLLVEMQAHSMRAVFLTVEGIGVIVAQKAINAAIDAVHDTVNGAVGIDLL